VEALGSRKRQKLNGFDLNSSSLVKTRVHNLKLICRTLLLAGLVGCTSSYEVGKKFEDSQIAQLEVGKTTFSEAEAIFGRPRTTSKNSSGEQTAAWVHGVGNSSFTPLPFARDAKHQSRSTVLVLRFNAAGLLLGYDVAESEQTSPR
jgi:hypothetical protein